MGMASCLVLRRKKGHVPWLQQQIRGTSRESKKKNKMGGGTPTSFGDALQCLAAYPSTSSPHCRGPFFGRKLDQGRCPTSGLC